MMGVEKYEFRHAIVIDVAHGEIHLAETEELIFNSEGGVDDFHSYAMFCFDKADDYSLIEALNLALNKFLEIEVHNEEEIPLVKSAFETVLNKKYYFIELILADAIKRFSMDYKFLKVKKKINIYLT
jgi:hypothetical protein